MKFSPRICSSWAAPRCEAVSGTINMPCRDRYIDIGDGATDQSTWLDIAAWPKS
jgi:hypothetical protein